ncbi:MAG: HD domain-containing protein [Nitrospinae bacterium]|nr:HD domain-containing protein [Nitrospinota bacterium]
MTSPQTLIDKTRAHVESALSDDGSGHDWWHVHRVWSLAKALADAEGAARTVVELAALLHDIGDWKFHGGDETVGPARAAEWLTSAGADPQTVSAVVEIVSGISFKGAGVPTPMRTLEGRVVQDADRLDAMGAMGIARAFAYGGHADRLIYHPGQPPVMHQSFEQYKKNDGHTINHFYEKLLLLKDRMNTAAGKKIAEERHRFMEIYLERFFKEWNGES